ncbi:MAG TPA: DUF6602 domain-containing protein [Thermodesulfobacteriota bacterium]|nr:DUF6602 domain-containing protein [Thermodesulfobacteriota bacterium]
MKFVHMMFPVKQLLSQCFMDRINYTKFLEAVGAEFQARISKAKYYKHPTGVGDALEDIVREYLRQILPERFSVDRGKIFDSEGRLSREFDIIISERFDVVPMMALAGRRIIPVEAVYGVIEVKSRLDLNNYNSFIQAVEQLDEMRRFYKSVDNSLVHSKEEGYSAQDNVPGKLWSGIITFNALQRKTLRALLQKFCEGLVFICIPHRELVLYWPNDTDFIHYPLKLKSLPLAVWLILELTTNNLRSRKLMPDFSRYRSNMLKKIIGETSDKLRLKRNTNKKGQRLKSSK